MTARITAGYKLSVLRLVHSNCPQKSSAASKPPSRLWDGCLTTTPPPLTREQLARQIQARIREVQALIAKREATEAMPKPKPIETPEAPAPGWKARQPAAVPLVNPRAPSVPATLDLNLEKYYAACALVGVAGAQAEEPDKQWLTDYALDVGELMAKKARKRWDR
jgi:hypothetical protein